MTNTKNMADWHKLTGYYPVRQSSIELLRKQGWFTQSPAATRGLQPAHQNRAQPRHRRRPERRGHPDPQDHRGRDAEGPGGRSVDAALQETKARADAALSEYNANFK